MRLNPCSNGRYSRRGSFVNSFNTDSVVLILVLMEDTLGAVMTWQSPKLASLNPCSNGRYSRSEDGNFDFLNEGES